MDVKVPLKAITGCDHNKLHTKTATPKTDNIIRQSLTIFIL